MIGHETLHKALWWFILSNVYVTQATLLRLNDHRSGGGFGGRQIDAIIWRWARAAGAKTGVGGHTAGIELASVISSKVVKMASKDFSCCGLAKVVSHGDPELAFDAFAGRFRY